VFDKPTGTTASNLLDYTNDNGINNPNTFADKTATSQKMYKLNAATNRTGLSRILKVMAGDKISILAKSYYRYSGGTVTKNEFNPSDLINSFLAVAAGGNRFRGLPIRDACRAYPSGDRASERAQQQPVASGLHGSSARYF